MPIDPGVEMRTILIDCAKQEVREHDCTSLEDLQACVGGSIATAFETENGDTCFVDDEGLLKSENKTFFIFDGAHQPFAGNGVIVGPADGDGETTPAQSTLESIRKRVRFMDQHTLALLLQANGAMN